ncbi:MAG: hypothetical protein PHF84_12660, partial [bacterium]|nr:hypothetical protein [bacterium]
MKKQISKENFILFYLTFVTGLYPVFLTADKIQEIIGLARYTAVLLHYMLVFVFFFLIPASILKYYFHEKLSGCGLNFKNINPGLKFMGLVFPVLVLVLFFSAGNSRIIREYPLAHISKQAYGLLVVMELFYLLYYIGWEFMFRGLVMQGLKKYSLVLLLVLQT